MLATTTLLHTKPSPFPKQTALISSLHCTDSARSLIIRGKSSSFLIASLGWDYINLELISHYETWSSYTGFQTIPFFSLYATHEQSFLATDPKIALRSPKLSLSIIQNLTSSVTHSQANTPVGSTFNENSTLFSHLCTCFSNKLTESGTVRDVRHKLTQPIFPSWKGSSKPERLSNLPGATQLSSSGTEPNAAILSAFSERWILRTSYISHLLVCKLTLFLSDVHNQEPCPLIPFSSE